MRITSKMWAFTCNALIILGLISSSAGEGGELSDYQSKLRATGDHMLETLEVSYVYGGGKIGTGHSCSECNRCLEEKNPSPKQRFSSCTVCRECSLDCSHFVQMVFAKSGLNLPYLTTSQMLELDPLSLERRYNLKVIGTSAQNAIAGDLLVYHGHVVLVEKIIGPDLADIIHATGGKDIQEPGQGIQRERYARISTFRGSLLRVLRHVKLAAVTPSANQFNERGLRAMPAKLRPVEKRRVE